ncbi:MAG TPA: hypothetical protein VGK59_01090 [Ohtaekwangia sp.]
MSVVRKSFLLFVVVIASAKVWGQAAQSPISTYGIGEPYGNALIHNQGMAGVGVSQPQYWFLNNQNPALLVYNGLTIFEAGVLIESRSIKSDTLTEKSQAGNMNYLATAFPIKRNKWTTSVGLMPYTNVDFAFQSVTILDDGENTKFYKREEGLGGLTQLYWSNGVRITPDFTAGVKATYLFGSVENVYSSQLEGTSFITSILEKTTAKDFNFSFGLSYSKDSLGTKNYRLSVGAVYSPESSMTSRRSDRFYTTTSAGDTLASEELNNIPGEIFLPGSFTFGVSFGRGQKWSVSTEYFYQDWANFTSVNPDDVQGMGKSWRAALGGELTPDPFGDKYLKRVTYRAGVSVEQYPFLANNNNKVKDLGASIGLSLPAGRSSLDLAFKWGKRGDKAETLLEETYFKIYFGITFNDQWFIKRKFD